MSKAIELLLLAVPYACLWAQTQTGDTPMPDGSALPIWERPLQFSKTYYVDAKSSSADDNGPGALSRPFRTISKAADVLQPGERVVIAEGVYREAIHPARGGTGPDKMISYEATEGAKVEVLGSAIIKDGWQPSTGWGFRRAGSQPPSRPPSVWQVTLDGSLFGGYNPFGMLNVPEQNWSLLDRERLMSMIGPRGPIQELAAMIPFPHRRGLLFVDGKPAEQVGSYASLVSSGQRAASPELFHAIGGSGARFWVEDNGLRLHVRFPDDDGPDRHVVEITTKEQVFAPTERHLGYIRVKGITFRYAGNGFPVPQRGLVSTNRGHH
jgi:hypothetical protein